jgi:hypothetical protein
MHLQRRAFDRRAHDVRSSRVGRRTRRQRRCQSPRSRRSSPSIGAYRERGGLYFPLASSEISSTRTRPRNEQLRGSGCATPQLRATIDTGGRSTECARAAGQLSIREATLSVCVIAASSPSDLSVRAATSTQRGRRDSALIQTTHSECSIQWKKSYQAAIIPLECEHLWHVGTKIRQP